MQQYIRIKLPVTNAKTDREETNLFPVTYVFRVYEQYTPHPDTAKMTVKGQNEDGTEFEQSIFSEHRDDQPYGEPVKIGMTRVLVDINIPTGGILSVALPLTYSEVEAKFRSEQKIIDLTEGTAND
jgi:hypothetical protein